MPFKIFDHRHYVIFDTTETGSIDFTEVKETSIHTLRLSVSGSQTFVSMKVIQCLLRYQV